MKNNHPLKLLVAAICIIILFLVLYFVHENRYLIIVILIPFVLAFLFFMVFVYERFYEHKTINDLRGEIIKSKYSSEILQSTAIAMQRLLKYERIFYQVYEKSNKVLSFEMNERGETIVILEENLKEKIEKEKYFSVKLGHRLSPAGVIYIPQDKIDKMNRRKKSLFLEITEQPSRILELLHFHVEREDVIEKFSNIIVEYQEQLTQQRDINNLLQRNFKEISAIYQVASTVLSTFNLDEMLNEIVDSVVRSFSASLCFILLKKEESDDLYVKAFKGVDLDFIKDIVIPPNRGVTQESFLAGETVSVPDVNEYPGYVSAIPNVKSELAIPILSGGKPFGVLDLESYDSRAFHQEDIDLLSSVATHIGMAITQARLVSELEKSKEKIEETFLNSIKALSTAIEAKDKYTKGHVERTATYAVEIGVGLGLPKKQLDTLYMAGILHDIGKIGVPGEILNKQGKLTDNEKKVIERHPLIGVDIIKDFLQVVIPGILYHHAWYTEEEDIFKGYPKGVEGEDIPLEARIIAVADAFDAMTTKRPYREALSRDEATRRLVAGKGKQFDPAVVDKFLNILESSSDHDISDKIRNLTM